MSKLELRLPSVSGEGQWPHISFDAKDWMQIENPYGELTPEVRGEIQQKTNMYLREAYMEGMAAPLKDTKARACAVHAAVENAYRAMAKHLHGGGDAAAHASRVIAQEFSNQYLPNEADKHDFIDAFLRSLRAATRFACEQLRSEKAIYRFRADGAAWARWVNRLHDIIDGAGLSACVSNGAEKWFRDAHSPFVVMVYKLQGCLPKPYRRRYRQRGPENKELVALAKAISRAISDARDK